MLSAELVLRFAQRAAQAFERNLTGLFVLAPRKSELGKRLAGSNVRTLWRAGVSATLVPIGDGLLLARKR